jgi:hypothetical protein
MLGLGYGTGIKIYRGVYARIIASSLSSSAIISVRSIYVSAKASRLHLSVHVPITSTLARNPNYSRSVCLFPVLVGPKERAYPDRLVKQQEQGTSNQILR